MEYSAPYGSPDPNASYVDRNTAAGTSGSRVPASAIEHGQREIVAVIEAAGLIPSGDDLTQLLQALQFLIDASTGGAGEESYLLMAQARTRLPIFPEILTGDGRLPITIPGTGQIRIPAGYTFLHRGIFILTTVQTDFATTASRTYHLRWSPSSGFSLRDTADVGYNAGSLPEANAAFDSSYDDMLVAKVVTNASNAPTVTSLINKATMTTSSMIEGINRVGTSNPTTYDISSSFNWARRPSTWSLVPARSIMGAPNDMDYNIGALGTTAAAMQTATPVFDIDRYRISQTLLVDCVDLFTAHFSARA